MNIKSIMMIIVHSAIEVTTKQATSQKKNNLRAKVDVTIQATKTRKYPEISTGDQVGIYSKKAITEKERTSQRSKETYTVERIEQKLGRSCFYFYLNGISRKYVRNKLVRV